MIEVSPISDTDYDLAFRTMRENMISYHERYGLPWNQDWVDRNYRQNENYSILRATNWIGFLTLEWRESDLFIHTLQLAKQAQGSVYGVRVYEWILEKMDVRGKDTIMCKAFRGSSVLRLYQRMGFSEVAHKDFFVTLEKRTKTGRS